MPLDIALIFVAVVRPNPTLSTKINHVDPSARERDYIESLRYYLGLQNPIKRVVVVENSNWPLERLRDAVGTHPDSQVEYISLDGGGLPERHSTGFGEQHIIDQAMERSRLIAESTHVAKITGRLRLLNIARLVDHVNAETELFCDLQSHWVPFSLNNRSASLIAIRWNPTHKVQCDTRFFVASKPFYEQHLRRLHLAAPDPAAYWIEGAWYEHIRPLHGSKGIHTRFPVQPQYSGFNGTIGFSYDAPKERMKNQLRNVCRRVVPWLWV